MPTVRLKKNWNGNFRRSIRDEKGAVVFVIEFTPGENLQVDLNTFEQLRGDFGKALEVISETETVPGAILTAVEPVPAATTEQALETLPEVTPEPALKKKR